MKQKLFFLSFCWAAASGCSTSIVEPSKDAGVTITVKNTTCGAGYCTPLRVVAFPGNQPLTPGGYWSIDLGLITTASACVTLPPTATFTVTNGATGAKTTYTWTSGDPISLGTISESASRIQASPTTDSFIPINASGWSFDMPGSSVKAGSACTS